ncbi:MAG: pyruvate dehydrogenase (acetyl-transferring) E1 component subunit alpha [Chloroflexi bacterium]|nr:pyruvate dehydrogenase (acetyl-transferring) E1 component subunit alpha [Chloroflexota bacterium]MCI0577200.1 pyruvate dehydrogenase (acetyl-transferring) E1 component subunit alpha [Chloroflexota bacterium]MCI0649090.1 pyruvate dehydrogenase (acetyl-transferring) E1 component subunit alpha [Chloroflexota bacterium]MCI0727008.1 pyruvate dehydrogenase (acetyl-transferring) E1 component subunit alpha [Chloroflexota bacterium]
MDKETLLEWYRQMVLIRRVEQRSAELYQQGKIGGFLHLYIGQEAVAVGAIAARQEGDHVITAYRDHGHALAVGSPTKKIMAELLGKATGLSKGKGGSMHLADRERNYWGGYAIVGGHLSLATGIALAEQYRETDSAVLCFFGDGSTNIGYFHEALNLAGVWDLPIVWICENNQYGMGTAVERASAVPKMVDKAKAYGMKGKQVNGMNVIEVHEATARALKDMRAGKGPQFLEMLTYRYEGHSMGDPLRYRTKDEVEKWRADDSIGILERHLLEQGLAGREKLEEIDQAVEQEVNAAVQFAEESPLPAPEELFRDIYVEA